MPTTPETPRPTRRTILKGFAGIIGATLLANRNISRATAEPTQNQLLGREVRMVIDDLPMSPARDDYKQDIESQKGEAREWFRAIETEVVQKINLPSVTTAWEEMKEDVTGVKETTGVKTSFALSVIPDFDKQTLDPKSQGDLVVYYPSIRPNERMIVMKEFLNITAIRDDKVPDVDSLLRLIHVHKASKAAAVEIADLVSAGTAFGDLSRIIRETPIVSSNYRKGEQVAKELYKEISTNSPDMASVLYDDTASVINK